MDFNDENKLIPVSNNSLIRARNSISIVNRIIKDISLFQFDKWNWWNNLSDEWKLILFYEGEIKNYGDHSIQTFNIEINESDLNRILELKSLIIGIFIEYYNHDYNSNKIPIEWSNWSLSDISPLNQLNKLTNLYLIGQEILNLIPSTKLVNLTHLYVGGEISDVSPIKDFLNLKYLSLNLDFYPSDYNGIRVLPRDHPSSRTFNRVTDLNHLSKLLRLEGLNLKRNHISDMTPLFNLTNLTELNLSHNQILDLSPLSNLTNLTKLELGYNQRINERISDISSLVNLTNLTKL